VRPFNDLKRYVRWPGRDEFSVFIPVGLIVALLIIGGTALFWGIFYFVRGVHAVVCWLVASRLTPRGHRLFGNYRESKAARELSSQGYGITPDWRIDAVSRIPKS
jgi:hypothetical protein